MCPPRADTKVCPYRFWGTPFLQEGSHFFSLSAHSAVDSSILMNGYLKGSPSHTRRLLIGWRR